MGAVVDAHCRIASGYCVGYPNGPGFGHLSSGFLDGQHTGNQLTANAGANLRELMARMGHDSERAALIYLHSSRARQRALTDAVGEAARAELARSRPRNASKLEGTQRARARHSRSASVDRQGFLPAQEVRPDRDSNAGPTA